MGAARARIHGQVDTGINMSDDDYALYSWKDRQRRLDPDSRRAFQGLLVLAAIAVFVGVVLLAA